MVRSNAKTVNEYLDELEGDIKTAIAKLRDITTETLPDFKESMDFGMPTYRDKDQVFAFAYQKTTSAYTSMIQK